jgi:hypothetical protein
MQKSREFINQLAGNTQRVIQHFQVLPSDPLGVEKQLEMMTAMHCNNLVYGWKMYPGFASKSIDPRGRPGYFLTDPDARRCIEHGLNLGVNRFAVHKGLPIGSFFEQEHNYPSDVGVVAKDYPDARFIIYHSAICAGHEQCDTNDPEGPYDATSARPTGTNALIRSLIDNNIPKNSNVYAEVGSAINQLLTDATAAAHFFGKLLKYVGEDRVVWGTDCTIYGSPQRFIEWFTQLQIPEQMQAEHGYPALTTDVKKKIFGLNSAALYGIDVEAKRCKILECPVTALKHTIDGELGGRRWAFEQHAGPKSWAEFDEDSRRARALGRPG